MLSKYERQMKTLAHQPRRDVVECFCDCGGEVVRLEKRGACLEWRRDRYLRSHANDLTQQR